MARIRTQSMSFRAPPLLQDQQKKDQTMMEIKEMLALMRYEWPQCTAEDSNPIEMAVLLLDDSSVGLAHKQQEFDELTNQVSSMLQKVVNENYEAFNSSIGEYNVLVRTLQDCQNSAQSIKTSLGKTTKDTHDRLDVLGELNNSSSRCSETLDILDAMDQLNNIPSKIDNLVAEKRVHEVYDIIADAYKIAEQYNLWLLTAMGSIKSYLEAQSNNLFGLIVSELHNEIYGKGGSAAVASAVTTGVQNTVLDILRNFNSLEPHLSAFTALFTLQSLELYVYNLANVEIQETSQYLVEPVLDFIKKYSHILSKHQGMANGANSTQIDGLYEEYTPDESFRYLYMLLATANKLNRLPQVLDILSNTVQQHVHNMITTVVSEIKINNSQNLRRLERLQELLLELSDSSVVILLLLFGSVFLKLLTIAKHLKLVEELSAMLSRDNIAETTARKTDFFASSISTLQKELHSLMSSYIYSVPYEIDHLVGTVQLVLAKRETFKLEDVPLESANSRSEKLQKSLLDMFPSFTLDTKLADSTPYIKDDSFNTTVEVLVPRLVINFRIILELLLVYSTGIDLLRGEGTAFCVSFMKSTFLPRLDEIFEESFSSCQFNEISYDYKQEIFQNAVDFKDLLFHFCQDFNTGTSYRKTYTKLLMKYVKDFVLSYRNFYKEILQRYANSSSSNTGSANGDEDEDNTKPSRISTWMKTPALNEASKHIIKGQQEYLPRESEIMLNSNSGTIFQLTKDDFLDNDTFEQVCLLLSTTEWIMEWLPNIPQEMFHLEEEPLPRSDQLKQEWCFLEGGRNYFDNEVNMMLDQTSLAEFNDYIAEITHIRDNSMIALRYDIRCKAIYYIGTSYRNLKWDLSSEPGDSDGLISEYNKQIFLADSKLSSIMTQEKKNSLFYGLDRFVEDLVIRGSQIVIKMNTNGVKRVLLNVFVLQQMLRNILQTPEEVNFNRSSQFFGLFTLPEQQLIELIRKNVAQVSELDYKSLIRLVFSERLSNGGSSFAKTKYNDVLRKSFE